MKEVAFSSFDDENNEQLPVKSKGTQVARETRQFEEGVDISMVRHSGERTSISEFATPLFGLVVRVQSLDYFSDVEELHHNTQAAMEVFRRDVQNEGYDVNNLNAASYAICALVDESVMAHQWGAESIWPSETMLSIFHNETWGGDQFFAILDRVMSEAQRYPDLLEFMQMCLLLGFEGKYHVMPNGEKRLEELIDKIDKILRKQNPEREKTRFLAPEENVHAAAGRSFMPSIGPWAIFGFWAVVLLVAYFIFAFFLGAQTNQFESDLQNQLNVTADEISRLE